MTINITSIPTLKDNYVWVISANNRAVIIDPGEAAPVKAYLQDHGLSLSAILITHHHWDHTDGILDLIANTTIPVFGSTPDKLKPITTALSENDIVRIENFPVEFRVLTIPGHTLDHIAYYSPDMLFCGDTLFSAGCGRLFEGTAEQMYASLQKMAALPNDTKVYCAHEYTLKNLAFAKVVAPNNKDIDARINIVTQLREKNLPSLPSNIREEKLTNPFLRCDASEVIASVEAYARKKVYTPEQVFLHLRQWKDNY